MILRVALLGLIACGLAGFGTIVWMVMPHNDAAVVASAPANKIRVLVAAKLLKAGSLLKTDDLVIREVDEDKLAEGYLTDEPGVRRGVMGSMVRRAFSPGDVVTTAEILRPGDHGFLSAVLRPGFRAVTVAVDAISGTAGLIWPGDHVDLILTQQMDDQVANTPGRRIAAETVQRDVRVIAIDQQLVSRFDGGRGLDAGADDHAGGVVVPMRSRCRWPHGWGGCRWRCGPPSAVRARTRRARPGPGDVSSALGQHGQQTDGGADDEGVRRVRRRQGVQVLMATTVACTLAFSHALWCPGCCFLVRSGCWRCCPGRSMAQVAGTRRPPTPNVPGAVLPVAGLPEQCRAQAGSRQTVALESGNGRILTLPGPATNVFVADPKVAEVRPASVEQPVRVRRGSGADDGGGDGRGRACGEPVRGDGAAQHVQCGRGRGGDRAAAAEQPDQA